MGYLFGFLLIIFLVAFFGMESFVVNYLQAADIKILGISLLSSGVQAFLGIGIIFCELGIVIFSMLDPVGNTIKEAIKPLVKMTFLSVFLKAIYDTFSPIAFSLLPTKVALVMGATSNDYSITEAVNNGSFNQNILFTLGAMILFIVTTSALREHGETRKIQVLEAKIKSLQKSLQ